MGRGEAGWGRMGRSKEGQTAGVEGGGEEKMPGLHCFQGSVRVGSGMGGFICNLSPVTVPGWPACCSVNLSPGAETVLSSGSRTSKDRIDQVNVTDVICAPDDGDKPVSTCLQMQDPLFWVKTIALISELSQEPSQTGLLNSRSPSGMEF